MQVSHHQGCQEPGLLSETERVYSYNTEGPHGAYFTTDLRQCI